MRTKRKEDIARKHVLRLLRQDAAQGMAEYTLLAALVAIAAIGAVTLLGGNISTMFNSLASFVTAAGS